MADAVRKGNAVISKPARERGIKKEKKKDENKVYAVNGWGKRNKKV